MCFPHAAEQLSPCATTTEPKGGNYRVYLLQIPVCDLEWEKSLQWEACVPQRKSSPLSLQLEKACEQQQRPSTTRNKLIILENTLKMDQRQDIKHWKLWEYWGIKKCERIVFYNPDMEKTQDRHKTEKLCKENVGLCKALIDTCPAEKISKIKSKINWE